MRIAESLSLPMYVSYFIFLPPELNILLVLLWSCYYFFFGRFLVLVLVLVLSMYTWNGINLFSYFS